MRIAEDSIDVDGCALLSRCIYILDAGYLSMQCSPSNRVNNLQVFSQAHIEEGFLDMALPRLYHRD